MTDNDRKINQLRAKIPTFSCIKGCHDCCGPVTVSSEEMARLPVKSDTEHDAALSELSCAYLGKDGCEIYAERPLICRLFGTTASLLCPNGQRPEYMIDVKVEREIHAFLQKLPMSKPNSMTSIWFCWVMAVRGSFKHSPN